MNIPPMTPADIVKLVKTAAVAAGYTAKGKTFYRRQQSLTILICCYKFSNFERVRVSAGLYPNAMVSADPKFRCEAYPIEFDASRMDGEPFSPVFRELAAAKSEPVTLTPAEVMPAMQAFLHWLDEYTKDEAKIRRMMLNDDPFPPGHALHNRIMKEWAAGTLDPSTYGPVWRP